MVFKPYTDPCHSRGRLCARGHGDRHGGGARAGGRGAGGGAPAGGTAGAGEGGGAEGAAGPAGGHAGEPVPVPHLPRALHLAGLPQLRTYLLLALPRTGDAPGGAGAETLAHADKGGVSKVIFKKVEILN